MAGLHLTSINAVWLMVRPPNLGVFIVIIFIWRSPEKQKRDFAACKLAVMLEVKVANKIIPDEIYDKLDRFTFAGLYDAIKQAKAWRKNNKHSEVSIECNIATYRFKWTDRSNMHLIDVIVKGKTQ